MFKKWLETGQEAPIMKDRIRITMVNAERYTWGGNVRFRDVGRFEGGADEYSSRECAEKDAIAWAKHHDVSTLYIESE